MREDSVSSEKGLIKATVMGLSYMGVVRLCTGHNSKDSFSSTASIREKKEVMSRGNPGWTAPGAQVASSELGP